MVEVGSNLVDTGPILSKSAPTRSNIDESWTDTTIVGQQLAKPGRTRPDFGKSWSKWTQIWLKSGQNWPGPATFGKTWSMFVQNGLNWAMFGRIRSKFPRHWFNFGRCRTNFGRCRALNFVNAGPDSAKLGRMLAGPQPTANVPHPALRQASGSILALRQASCLI